ncbi:MAG: phosphoglucosamine mutase [Acidimicrobiia bacterium]|nr:phosphoglucosamine mutase [Acidimicrobiia bacterium]MDH4306946.1 phosphoglucosamine mutase [Acidimicrobiia bacterium]MDH5292896.1 phosphoglucosamine mutase [Acidimicrobiia bacterium]
MLGERTRLFGTDGVRGVANLELTPELALQIGRAAGSLVIGGSALVGRDTRRSGEMLSAALQAGFHSSGVDTVDVGVLPSGAISHLTARAGVDMGVVVSASHNPAADNGIKILGRRGTKLTDAEEAKIEERLHSDSYSTPYGAAVGTRFVDTTGMDRYVADLAREASYTFNGIDLVLDCAHGAAYRAAPALFRKLRANVSVLADEPSGMNINDGCGATHPEFLASKVDGRVGFAFDGDADRLIAVDEEGVVVNGDVIMAIIARHWKSTNRLKNNLVVATVMSNLGFRKALEEAGIGLVETKVGDRYVLEAMVANKAILGGEQSGHVIFLDRGRTGDGLLTGVRLLEVVAGSGKPLAQLRAEAMVEYPQVLINVRGVDRERLADASRVWEAVASVETDLGGDGRVLVRASGTEPMVRVMVEAATEETAQEYAERIAAVVGEELTTSG